MDILQKVCLALTIVGALNWGMVGLFDFNLVSTIFGIETLITNLIYSLVGLCGIINIGLLIQPIKH